MNEEPLSRREAEIARAYSDGANYREIAERLGIAPTTVRTHLGTIYRKLGVGSKIQLLRMLNAASTGESATAAHSGEISGLMARPSVVVLPFEDRSVDADQEALIDGLVEAVTATLSRFRMLMVISQASSLSYRGSAKDLRTIASELGARYAVRGVFNRSGGRVRVSAELIDTTTGTHVWSRNFDGAWADIFALQDDLACAIAAEIAPEIKTWELQAARSRRTSECGAWELYCRAHHAMYRFSQRDYVIARDLCHQAIAIDDQFSLVYTLLSQIHFMEAIAGFSPDPRESLSQGLYNGRKALEIDERDEVAYACLACNLVMSGAFDEAFLVLERGMQINPNASELYNARALAHAFAPQGDLAQVIADGERALICSPNDPMRWTCFGSIAMAHLADERNGSLEEALKHFQASASAPNTSWMAFSGAALASLALDNMDSFRQHLTRARDMKPDLSVDDLFKTFGHLFARSPRMQLLAERLATAFPFA